MGVRVIAYDVAPCGGFFKKVRAFARVFPNYEEGCAGFIEIQEIEQFRRDCGIRPIVKRESKLTRRIRAANGRAEELRARIDRCVSNKTGSRGCQSRWRGNQP